MTLSVLGVSCITVNSERQFYWHVQSCGVRLVDRTSCQMVCHIASHVDVVAIIILTVLSAVHLVRHSCPLCIVACSLKATWQSACSSSAVYVSHTASESHSVGSYHSVVVLTQVR